LPKDTTSELTGSKEEIILSRTEKRSEEDIAVGDKNSLGASKFSPNIFHLPEYSQENEGLQKKGFELISVSKKK